MISPDILPTYEELRWQWTHEWATAPRNIWNGGKTEVLHLFRCYIHTHTDTHTREQQRKTTRPRPSSFGFQKVARGLPRCTCQALTWLLPIAPHQHRHPAAWPSDRRLPAIGFHVVNMRQPYSNRMQHQLPIRSQHHLPWHTYPSFSNKPFRIPPPTNPPTFIPPRWGPWYYDHPTTPPPPSSGVVHHHPQHLHQPHSLTKASKQPCKTISKQNPNRPGINPSLNTKSLNHAKKILYHPKKL